MARARLLFDCPMCGMRVSGSHFDKAPALIEPNIVMQSYRNRRGRGGIENVFQPLETTKGSGAVALHSAFLRMLLEQAERAVRVLRFALGDSETEQESLATTESEVESYLASALYTGTAFESEEPSWQRNLPQAGIETKTDSFVTQASASISKSVIVE